MTGHTSFQRLFNVILLTSYFVMDIPDSDFAEAISVTSPVRHTRKASHAKLQNEVLYYKDI